MRRCVLVAFAAIILSIAAFGKKEQKITLPDLSGLVKTSRVFTKTSSFNAGGRIQVSTGEMGSLSVIGWERPEVRIEATITAWGNDQADSEKNLELINPKVTRGDVAITLTTEAPAGFLRGRIDYVLRVPSYRTDFVVRSMRGAVSFQDLNGWMEVDTGIGYLRLANLSGYVSARTREGDVQVQLKGGRWDGLELSAMTGKGDATIFMPTDYQTDLTLITLKGEIQIEYPSFQIDEEEFKIVPAVKKKGMYVNQRIRDGGPAVTVQTGDGKGRLQGYDRRLETLATPTAESKVPVP